MSILKALLVVCVVAAPGLMVSAEISSPCPDLFRYESEQPGQWAGALTISSDSDLHGVWIRLLFDKKLSQLTVADDYVEVVESQDNEILLKNRNILLKARIPKTIKIFVKYEGTEAPKLIGFRLNARTVCPAEPNNLPTEYFLGDKDSKYFLSAVLSKPKNRGNTPQYECGILPKKAGATVHPWKASLSVEKHGKEQHVCEATLISPTHLVTAAHCVAFKQSNIKVPEQLWKVHLGKQLLNVEKITINPGYEFVNLLNDIALIELKSPVEVNDLVRPICLEQSVDAEKKKGVIAEYKDGDVSKLVETTVQELSGNECIKRVPDLTPLIGDNVYCASYLSDEVECVGESGNSLTLLHKNAWHLRGILTLGSALQNKYVCNQSSTVLLTDVSRYLKWIQATIS